MGKLAVIIDDDEDDVTFLSETLCQVDATIECLTFQSPARAIIELSKLTEIVPAYIFIDYNMPMINGYECYKRLHDIDRFAATKFILNSTNVDNEVKEKFLAHGGHFMFKKPFSTEGYKKLIIEALGEITTQSV